GAPGGAEWVGEALSRKLAASLPSLASIPIESARACLRTFAPDRRYLIGPDPRLTGFFWVAGLGGTGATAGAAAGELAATLLLGSPAPGNARAVGPARVSEGGTRKGACELNTRHAPPR